MGTELVIPESVIKSLNNLPREIRLKFWEQVERLLQNPSYPSLRNEKLAGTDEWAFSITMNYRATYYREGKRLFITAVGTHKEILGTKNGTVLFSPRLFPFVRM
ncbi:MAG: hypothetical protein AB1488_06160 [Nitrospirota bacterium]